MGMSTEVTVEGTLRCLSEEQAANFRAGVVDHIRLSRAEPGCIAFNITETDDPMVWRVSERFESPEAFEAHKARMATSDWPRHAEGIERDLTITGMP